MEKRVEIYTCSHFEKEVYNRGDKGMDDGAFSYMFIKV